MSFEPLKMLGRGAGGRMTGVVVVAKTRRNMHSLEIVLGEDINARLDYERCDAALGTGKDTGWLRLSKANGLGGMKLQHPSQGHQTLVTIGALTCEKHGREHVKHKFVNGALLVKLPDWVSLTPRT